MTPAKKRDLAAYRERRDEEFETGMTGLLAEDKHLLAPPKTRTNDWSLEQLQRWLESVRRARDAFEVHQELVRKSMQPERDVMKAWLQ